MDDKDFDLEGFDFDAELSKLIDAEEEKSLNVVSSVDETVVQVCRTIITFPTDSVQFVRMALKRAGHNIEPVKSNMGLVMVFLEDEVVASPLDILMDVNERSLPDSHLDIVVDGSAFASSHGVVVLTAWLQKVDVEDADLGQVVCKRFVNGELEENMPPSIVLAAFSDDIEELLLGFVSYEKYLQQKKKSSWFDGLFSCDDGKN